MYPPWAGVLTAGCSGAVNPGCSQSFQQGSHRGWIRRKPGAGNVRLFGMKMTGSIFPEPPGREKLISIRLSAASRSIAFLSTSMALKDRFSGRLTGARP